MVSTAQQQMSDLSLFDFQLQREEAEVQHVACQGQTEKHKSN